MCRAGAIQWMPRTKVILSIAVAGILTVADAAFGVPHLVTGAKTVDFGAVAGTNSLTFSLSVTNAGDADLVVSKVRTCCGASAEPSTFTLGPSASTNINIVLPPVLKPGEVNKSIFIMSNDPAEPIQELKTRRRIVSEGGK